MPSLTTFSLFLLAIFVAFEGTAALDLAGRDDVQENDAEVNSVTRKLIQLLLKSLPSIFELANEMILGPPYSFLATQRELLMVNVTDLSQPATVVATLETGEFFVAIDYDPVDDFVYWSTNQRMKRMKVDDTGRQEILFSNSSHGIAIDWIARNIYWGDEDANSIFVSRLDGSYRKTLINEGLNGPRGIAVDPGKGRLYWTEWKSNPRIASAALDGSDVKTLVSSEIGWPNGIALDYYRQLIYFADAKFDRIEVVGMDGTGRKVVTDDKVPHVFGLSYLSGYLYWTDWMYERAQRAPVTDPSDRTTLEVSRRRLMGIKTTYLDPIKLSGTKMNPCVTDNGGCSHLCFYTGRGATCGYPDQ